MQESKINPADFEILIKQEGAINQMFIRKRKQKLKDGTEVIKYQAVRNYIVEGKSRQEVIALGNHRSIEEAIKEQMLFVDTMAKLLAKPLSEYRQTRWKRDLGYITTYMPTKYAEKRRAKILSMYEKLKARLDKLEHFNKGYKRHYEHENVPW